MATLEATDLIKAYGKRTVVRGVSLTVNQGEIVGLLGRNGAGKSTTFKMIMGIVRPARGRIMLDGHDVTKMPLYKRARRGLGYLAQEPTIFQKLSVENNLRAILETTKLTKQQQNERLDQLLDEFGLKPIRGNMAITCSGGERRRLEIARTLVTNPKIVLLDEPFAGVDPIAVEDIKQLVRGLVKRGIGVLLTDHNVREVLTMTSRSYILSEGQILKEGTPVEIVDDPIVKKEYLGERFKLDHDDRYIET
ncbi:MAG: LPS export ABC transporter ATP-binding protein [Planctomycetes bacterium]|nr:LPS export ABC transporter ATP-binding protein [Planctomycetota bacterium]NUQ36151.1 LPS export ABC transporter ATP-binding protein [Planctomycetaceae bacterium]